MKKRFNVYIVGPDNLIANMWRNEGHDIVSRQHQADIVQFIGGVDINPDLYGEIRLPTTIVNPACDLRDYGAWECLIPARQMAVGICRGGQFLNVQNNGFMWQHVSGHTDSHKITDLTGLTQGKEITVTSTHHQMMIPDSSGEVLAYADNLARDHKSGIQREYDGVDPEVIWYDKTRCLCFQPHPEFKKGEHTKYFFDLIHLLF